MANREQVDRLMGSVKAWNMWRAEYPGIVDFDLREADLHKAFLPDADLCEADLSGANLREANLYRVDLSRAILRSADLRDANLRGTDLNGAYLSGADLRSADLRGDVHYRGVFFTNLTGAFLDGADLRGANFGWTVLGDIDLSKTNWLDEVKHSQSSQISTSTLQLSNGQIPEAFLRGCGLSDWEIESAKLYRPGLAPDQVTDITYKVCQLRAGSPIQYYSCFISYSSKDDAFAKRLHDDLQNSGVRCWFAPEDLKIGDKFRGRIDDAIRIHDKLLIVLSENSINSTWVEKEVETAFEKEGKNKRIVLFPIRLDDGVMKTDQAWAADIRRTRHIGDFSNWKDKESYQKAFERLLKDLMAKGNEKE